MKSVRFLQTDPILASARLRNLIPMGELRKRGWKDGSDVLVLSKHNWDWNDNLRHEYGKIVFDVCDDWFDEPGLSLHYRTACKMADAVTCNSESMRERIMEVTGKDAAVIDDPYEHDEEMPGAGSGVLWFGNRKGLSDLYYVLDRVRYPITVVSDYPAAWSIPWSMEAQAKALDECRCVFIPPTRMKCRSANRAVTAIRAGRMVVAGDIPSYRDIPGIVVNDDFERGLDVAMHDDCTERIRMAQIYVRERFSPERIADQWEAVLA